MRQWLNWLIAAPAGRQDRYLPRTGLQFRLIACASRWVKLRYLAGWQGGTPVVAAQGDALLALRCTGDNTCRSSLAACANCRITGTRQAHHVAHELLASSIAVAVSARSSTTRCR